MTTRDTCSSCNAELIGDARHYSEDNSCFCWACCPVSDIETGDVREVPSDLVTR